MSALIMDGTYCNPAMMLGILHDCRFAGGISASGQSAGFGGNLFTRDTLRVLRDVMHVPQMQSFVRQMLVTLLQWQGVKDDPTTNESKNALQHQVFRQIIGGVQLSDSIVESAEYWTGQWGVPMTHTPGTGEQFVIYNSSDGPPLYLITLCEYIAHYGLDILRDRYLHQPTGEIREVADGALRCVTFILDQIKKGEEAGHGLYGVPNTNPRQTSPSGVMRDGFDAYVTRSGRPADYGSMVYLENQALVHEALMAAAVHLPQYSLTGRVWQATARELRDRTIDRLWLEDDQFFAAGLDKFGVVDMVSSAAFELLDTMLFDTLDDGPDYVRALATRLYSPEFMTPIGCRMTSTVHAEQEGEYAPYQGSSAVWGVTNGIIESGLRRQRLGVAWRDFANHRVLWWIDSAREAYEMTFVDHEGNPVISPTYVSQESAAQQDRSVLFPAEFGQPDQAWTASAVLRMLTSDYAAVAEQGTWQRTLDIELSAKAHDLPALSDLDQPIRQPLLDLDRGRELKERRKEQLAAVAL